MGIQAICGRIRGYRAGDPSSEHGAPLDVSSAIRTALRVALRLATDACKLDDQLGNVTSFAAVDDRIVRCEGNTSVKKICSPCPAFVRRKPGDQGKLVEIEEHRLTRVVAISDLGVSASFFAAGVASSPSGRPALSAVSRARSAKYRENGFAAPEHSRGESEPTTKPLKLDPELDLARFEPDVLARDGPLLATEKNPAHRYAGRPREAHPPSHLLPPRCPDALPRQREASRTQGGSGRAGGRALSRESRGGQATPSCRGAENRALKGECRS